jgi:hypothetical protein
MNDAERAMAANAQGISIVLPPFAAKLHRARAELRIIEERLTLAVPEGYLDRVIELCAALRPLDRRDAEAITLGPEEIHSPEEHE